LTPCARGPYPPIVTRLWRSLCKLAAIPLGIAFGCFNSSPLSGAPCTVADRCGGELRCLDGFCKPASCEGNEKCSPFKAPCAKGGEQQCLGYGSHGCFYALEEETAGYCAYTCELAEQCPTGTDGSTAIPACAEAEVVYEDGVQEKSESFGFCVLDCSKDRTCPSDMHCTDVNLLAGPAAVCLSGPPR